jgi:hypothetical protein
MQTKPIRVSPDLHRPGLDPAPVRPPNLFFIASRWTANCPTCGFQLAEGNRQSRVERKAARTSCPVCVEVA